MLEEIRLSHRIVYFENKVLRRYGTTAPALLAPRLGRNSVTLKLISVGLLLALLLIPTSMVESLISERASNRGSATEAISAQWGGAQLVLGPVLVPPYPALETAEGHTTKVTRYLSILPDTLSSTGTLAPGRRHCGTYKAVVYQAGLQVQRRISSSAAGRPGRNGGLRALARGPRGAGHFQP